MKNKIQLLSKVTAVLILSITLACSSASAATYTAVASGNWNDIATWGGTAPGYAVTADQITIPANFTVTLTQNIWLNTILDTLTINGTLNAGTGDSLIVGTGAVVAGTGIININAMILNIGASMLFTGNATVNILTSSVVGLQAAANITVNNTLTLAAGQLSIATAGALTMATNSTIMISGGALSLLGTGMALLTNTYNVTYTVACTAGTELSGAGLNNVTMDVGNTNNLTLSGDINIHGILTLTSGTLLLNNHNLTINGTIAASGNGVVSSTTPSKVIIHSNGSVGGTLRFDAINNAVSVLTIGFTGNAKNMIALGSNVVIGDSLNLIKGLVNTNNYAITMTALSTIAGGSDSSYVITSAAGYLSIYHLAGGAVRLYPIGTAASYAPARIQLNTASANGNVQVSVDSNVYQQGTAGFNLAASQPIVKATWYVHSDITTTLDLNLTTIWHTALEVNAFSVLHAYIAHYTNNAWDVQTSGTANTEAAGMYSIQRMNITSLSPFAVFGKNASTGTVAITNAGAQFAIYPNPATDYITIKALATLTTPVRVDISDVTGRVLVSYMLQDNTNPNVSLSSLSNGNYFVHLYNSNVNVVKQISKL